MPDQRGQPMQPIVGRWQVQVIRDGASWIALARCLGLAVGPDAAVQPVSDPPWNDLGAVNGHTEEDALAAVEQIIRSARVEFVSGGAGPVL